MLRRTVASACSEQGVPDAEEGGRFIPLQSRIDQLQGKLIPATYQAARTAKLLGDAGAHEEAEDRFGPVDVKLAAETLLVVRQLLANLYELPGQVEALRQP
jgi:hypothetical protein